MEALTDLARTTGETGRLFRAGYEAGIGCPIPARVTRIVVCGMGGSILGAELFETFARQERLGLSVEIWQTYGLPASACDAHTLVYCVSYSGNTEETLSSFDAAVKQKCSVITLAHDGTLFEKARRRRAVHAFIPATVVPRLAAGYVFGFLAGAHVRSVAMRKAVRSLSLPLTALQRQGDAIGQALAQKHVLVYTPFAWKSLAHAWEIHVNETAGLLAFGDDIPDIDHHTLAALSRTKHPLEFHAVIVADPSDTPRMKQRTALSVRTLKKLGVRTTVITLSGRDSATRLLSNIVLASFSSLACARHTRYNPLTNTIQESFKQSLRAETRRA